MSFQNIHNYLTDKLCDRSLLFAPFYTKLMFSYFLRGKMGDIVAPRTDKSHEIWSYLKSGQYNKAVDAIREMGDAFDVNRADPVSSLTPLHIASASGHLELTVELLSQGAIVSAVDKDQNNSLHLAALNGHKGVVEVLLRYGGDPSVPNGNGLLPVELAKDRFVRDLFLRDRSSIFSPVVQARSLFAEYLANQRPPLGASSSAAEQETHRPVRLENDFAAVSLQTEPTEAVAAPPMNAAAAASAAAPQTPQPSRPHSPRATFTSHNVAFYSPGPSAPPPQSQTPGLVYSFNFNHSASRSPALFSPEPRMNASVSTGEFGGVSGVGSGVGGSAAETEELRELVMEAAEETARANMDDHRIKLVNLIQNNNERNTAGLAELLELNPSLATARLLSEISQGLTDGQTPLHVAARFNNVAALELLLARDSAEAPVSSWVRDMQGRTPLHIAAMHNSAAAAAFLRSRMRSERSASSSSSFSSSSESLATAAETAKATDAEARAAAAAVTWSPSTRGNSEQQEEDWADPADPVGERAPLDLAGLTPLGCAKLAVVTRKIKQVSGEVQTLLFSPGDRSVLPRTPRAGKSPAPRLLRAASGSVYASGSGSVYASGSKSGSGFGLLASPAPAAAVVRPWLPASVTDTPTVAPATPPPLSATVAATTIADGDGDGDAAGAVDASASVALVYGLAEAQGWTSGMEDRAFCLSPLASYQQQLHPSVTPLPLPHNNSTNNSQGWEGWSLFGLLDGHGGSFSSDFLSRHLPATLLRLATHQQQEEGLCDTPESVAALLTDTCREADQLLATQPRMSVTRHARTGRLQVVDSSGATGLLLLVTPRLLCVANAGDSRAVLGRRVSVLSSSSSSDTGVNSGDGVNSGVDASNNTSGNNSNNGNNSGNNTTNNNSGGNNTTSNNNTNNNTSGNNTTSNNSGSGRRVEWRAQELSRDHKPQLPEEARRIEAAGGAVSQVPGNDSVWELSVGDAAGQRLRVSRGFGDFCFKQRPDTPWDRQPVTACPEVSATPRDTERDGFVLLACDGVWDVMDSQAAVAFVATHLFPRDNPQQTEAAAETEGLEGEGAGGGTKTRTGTEEAATATTTSSTTTADASVGVGVAEVARVCDLLLAECLARGSRDNMTVWLVLFQRVSVTTASSSAFYYTASSGASGASGSSSRSLSRSVSPRLSSPRVSPRASFATTNNNTNSNNNSNNSSGSGAVSYVRDPALWEVDVPQPPPAVLRSAQRLRHTNSNNNSDNNSDNTNDNTNDNSDVGDNHHHHHRDQQQLKEQHVAPLAAGTPDRRTRTAAAEEREVPEPPEQEPGIMSPLCSAPRSSSISSSSNNNHNRTNNNNNSDPDRDPDRDPDLDLEQELHRDRHTAVVAAAAERDEGEAGSETDAADWTSDSRVQRQLRFDSL